MAFLVRKLIKRDRLSVLGDIQDINDVKADIPTTEFRTTDGKLSTWLINSLDDLKDAVLAIVVSSSEVTKMDFIVIDTSLLEKYSLEYEQTYAGREIAVADLQHTHHDIVDITISKLINCTNLYMDIIKNETDEEKYIVRFTAGEIKEILRQAIIQDRIDDSKTDTKVRDIISKLKAAV